jgi:hypothetical protein
MHGTKTAIDGCLSRGSPSCAAGPGRGLRRAVGLALALCLGLVACGGPLSEGKAEFNAGHYPHAKQIFASIEDESRNYDERDRATYALYRGLTLRALGDNGDGATWLREAKAIEETRPGTLEPGDTLRLKAALESAE